MAKAPAKIFKFFALRNYQADLVGEIFAAFETDHRVLAQIATGAGKTAIGAAIAERFVKQEGRVLWLAHRDELLTQAHSKLKEVCIVPVGLIQSGTKIDSTLPIQVASIQTLSRALKGKGSSVKELLESFDLIVTDEAHRAVSSSYQVIYDACPEAYHLGLTATPKRLDGKGLDDVYDRLICGVSTSWLIQNNWLCEYRLFAATRTIETKGIRKVAGDFNSKGLRLAAMSADIMGEIVPTWQRHANGLKTVVFCCDIEHSLAVCKLYQDEGIAAAHLDGDTPKTERRRILAKLEAGEITVLTNCGIVSEGLDIPGIECAQILRPTESLSLHLQMPGRALRKLEGKDISIILDHTKNWRTHGLIDDEREWTLEGTVRRTPRLLEVNPETNEIVEVAERIITHDQTVEMTEITREVDAEVKAAAQRLSQMFEKPLSGSLFDLPTATLPSPYPWIDDLLTRQRTYSLHRGWAAYRVIEQLQDEQNPDLEALQYVGRKLGYRSGWARHAWQDLKATIESMKEAQWATGNGEAEVFEAETVDNTEENEPIQCCKSQQVIECLINSERLPFNVRELFQRNKENFDLTYIHPLLDCNPAQLTIHLNCFNSGSTELWFSKMIEHQAIIEEVINHEINQWISLGFSCQFPAISTAACCPTCKSRHFQLHPGKSPHYAKLLCSNLHFIQWLSKVKVHGFEQHSLLN